ncbi:hypothetical protein HC031_01570 [Planosporangium thailandense]|uniref:Uncharacterized protein n=1 Tax=Planosporangium thailandense TaxID=765197 RepID=A0ABX0XR01_9ACTN|nr:hypothetical protein [Planosporangium thailandense]NJC68417.1 hypothetical protein [Planosporangium thailandense]
MIRRYTAASLEAPDRLFQVTHVSRTHTQLFLQSNAAKSAGFEHRLEVWFQSVQYFCMPFVLRGLSLRKASQDERASLSELHGLEADPRWDLYLLSRSHDWFIVSARPMWAEADLEYDDEPAFWSYAGQDDAVISMGTLE